MQDSVQQWGVAQLGAVLQPGGDGGGGEGGDSVSVSGERGGRGGRGGAAAVRVLDACAAPGGKSRALLHHAPHVALTSLDRDAKKVAFYPPLPSAASEPLHPAPCTLHPAPKPHHPSPTPTF